MNSQEESEGRSIGKRMFASGRIEDGKIVYKDECGRHHAPERNGARHWPTMRAST